MVFVISLSYYKEINIVWVAIVRTCGNRSEMFHSHKPHTHFWNFLPHPFASELPHPQTCAHVNVRIHQQFAKKPTCNLPSKDLAIVIHLVLESWVVMAFSNSSKVLFFLSFFTNDLTAFSDHFSSCSFLASPLRHPRRRFTIGGVNGNMEVMPRPLLNNRPRPIPDKLRNQSWWIFVVVFFKNQSKNQAGLLTGQKILVNWHKREKKKSILLFLAFSLQYIFLSFLWLWRESQKCQK